MMRTRLPRWSQRLRRLIPRPATWSPLARREALALSVLVGVFILAFLPATSDARREYRDGLRRQDLRTLKTEVEQWFNDHSAYPLHPSGDSQWCGTSDDPEDWFFQDILVHERSRLEPLRDPFHHRRWAYRYCPTVVVPAQKETPARTTGFYLDTRLEQQKEERRDWNSEFNVFERVVTINGAAHYQICGGEYAECGSRPEGQ